MRRRLNKARDPTGLELPSYDARLCPDPCAGPCGGCPDRVVCRCLKVTEVVIVEAVTGLGLRTVKEVRRVTGAGDGCTCCHTHIRTLIEAHAPVGTAVVVG